MAADTNRETIEMTAVPSLSDAQLEQIAQLLGNCGSGSEIDRMLGSCNMEDNSGESTKWKRLYWVFRDYQQRNRCANQVLHFIQTFLAPVRFVNDNEKFESSRKSLNAVLAFSGLEYGPDGKFSRGKLAETIEEAERRVRTIQAKFQGRRLHPEVLRYCRAELLQDNFFHAVFEASKGLAQRIRDLSGVQADGAALVDKVFRIERPVLAINSLRTETEKSEHKGFAALLKGCFGAVRNPLAHEPKILWTGEDDAADYFSLISLLHRKLDDAVRTGL